MANGEIKETLEDSGVSVEQLLEIVLSQLASEESATLVRNQILDWWPPFAVLLSTLVIIVIYNRLVVSRTRKDKNMRIGGQLVKVLIILASVVMTILTLPVSEPTRQQLLSVYGLVITAVITLSSTTLVANAIAGLMLRGSVSFKPGDFIRIGDQFGRVTEQGFLRTEIQTEERDLTTLPNQYLISNPYTVVHGDGTVVSATVTLGYDIDRHRIESALIAAAKDAKLKDPFVQVTDLGDYSVSYRVSGFLAEVTQLLSTRSALRKKMLDSLHAANIEIVSPTFMNQRQYDAGKQFVPRGGMQPAINEDGMVLPEDVIFDKADIAAAVEQLKSEKADLAKKLEVLTKGQPAEPEAAVAFQIRYLTSRLEAVRDLLKQHIQDDKSGGS